MGQTCEHNIIDINFWLRKVKSILAFVTKDITLHKKWSFPLRISSVNVTKSTGNYVKNKDRLFTSDFSFFALIKKWYYPNDLK